MKIGLITDIHENANLLKEALRLAAKNKCDEIVCLGNIVGFDRRFENHDLFAAGRLLVFHIDGRDPFKKDIGPWLRSPSAVFKGISF